MNEYNYLLSSDGTRIHYRIHKQKKKWILFLHGVGSNISCWKPFYHFFEHRGYSTICIDLRGHGKSMSDNVNLDRMSKDVLDILHREHVDSVDVIGMCLGASVALKAYEKEPKRFGKLLLLALFNKNTSRFRFLLKPLNYLGYLVFSLIPKKRSYPQIDYSKTSRAPSFLHIVRELKGMRPSHWFLVVHYLFNDKVNFKKIRTPFKLIYGDKDWLVKKKIPHKVVIRNVDHVLIARKPRMLLRVLEESLG